LLSSASNLSQYFAVDVCYRKSQLVK
jgi:hypothetical protein